MSLSSRYLTENDLSTNSNMDENEQADRNLLNQSENVIIRSSSLKNLTRNF